MTSTSVQSFIEMQNSTINRLYETIDKLKEEIESLKEENAQLKKNQLGAMLSGVNDHDDTSWMDVDLNTKGILG